MNKDRISIEKFKSLIGSNDGQVRDKEIEGDWDYFYDFEQSKLNIKNCDFLGNISITTLKENKQIYFIDCTFKNIFSVDNIQSDLILNFHDCDFKEKVRFSSIKNFWVSIINSRFEEEVEFSEIHETSQIRIHSNKPEKVSFKKKLLFMSCTAHLLDINKASFVDIEFQYYSPLNIHIRNSSILTFKTFGLRDFNKLIIDNTKIGKIDIQYLLLTGMIEIDYCEIDMIDLSNYESKGGLTKFYDVRISKLLNLKKSSLKGIEFSNIYMKDAQLVLDNSFLNEFRFSNIVWPKENIVISENQFLNIDYSEKENAYVLREVYRQLKNASKSQSSNIEALNFYRNEMVEYSKYTYKNTDIIWWDRFIIRVNKITSDFGQSVKRPLIGLFLVHACLFSVLIAVNGSNKISFVNFNEHNWRYFWRGLGDFFYLLNPAHSFLDTKYGVLDFLMRVSSGFFIYHFIKATRKYSF